MKKAKLIGMLLATLVVGALIGALGTGVVINQRLDRLREISHTRGFSMALERVIEPTDEVQREAIRTVLEASGMRLSKLRRSHFDEMRTIIDSTRKSLMPLLTDGQRERLENWFARDHFMDRRRHRSGKQMRSPEPPPLK